MGVAHPASRYPAPRLPDVASEKDRERLSPAAIKAFFRFVDTWKITATDAMLLLGGMPSSSYYALRQKPVRTLDVDMFVRVSYLVGIYKALHLIHSDALADRWITMPNDNPIFRGNVPLGYMIHGGIPGFQVVRRLLDARRGGA